MITDLRHQGRDELGNATKAYGPFPRPTPHANRTVLSDGALMARRGQLSPGPRASHASSSAVHLVTTAHMRTEVIETGWSHAELACQWRPSVRTATFPPSLVSRLTSPLGPFPPRGPRVPEAPRPRSKGVGAAAATGTRRDLTCHVPARGSSDAGRPSDPARVPGSAALVVQDVPRTCAMHVSPGRDERRCVVGQPIMSNANASRYRRVERQWLRGVRRAVHREMCRGEGACGSGCVRASHAEELTARHTAPMPPRRRLGVRSSPAR